MSEEQYRIEQYNAEHEDGTLTSCQMFGHRYSFDDDSEVFDQCLDCGEPLIS